MKIRRNTLFDFTFLFIILLLTVLSIFSYQRIIDLDKRADWITHTNHVKLRLEQVLSFVKDAETGQRGFLLSGDSIHLQLYIQDFSKNLALFDEIDSLLSDNRAQQESGRSLKRLVSQRIDRLNMVIAMRNQHSGRMAEVMLEGKGIMDKVRSLVTQMIRIEDRMLNTRIQQKNYAAIITPRYSLLLAVLAIFTVAFTYYIFRSESRLRFNAEDSIKKLHEYFKDLPAVFAILKGPQHVHELTNSLYNDITGDRDILGKPVKKVLPELEEQGYFELLDKVYTSGEQFVGKEMPFRIQRPDGTAEKVYYNFTFQPIFDRNKNVDGILIFGYDITEMIRSRNKVEEAEQRSRLAIEAANIGTFDWDMEKQVFISSERLIDIFGFKDQKDVTHQDLIRTFHPDDKATRDKAVENSYSKGSLVYEARIIRPDGLTKWVNVYGKILYNDGRETLRMYGTVLDVTEQKIIIEELTRSEAQFRLLSDSMPQFVWTSDVNGHFNYFSKAVYDYTGADPSCFLAENWLSIVHPEDKAGNIERWKQAVTTGEEFVFEHRLKNSAGEYRWYLSRALPQKGNKGEIQRWVGTSTDIQDHKDVSERLEQQVKARTLELGDLNRHLLIQNNIFSQAEENAHIGSYSWNLNTGALEYSDNLFRLFGFEPNEFEPTFEKYLSLIHPDDREQVKKDGEETLTTKNLVAHVYRVITKSGAIKYFRSTGKLFGKEDEVVFLIGTVQDISQDRLYNEMLEAKNIELERSNAELESFNYIASHDLQEPLRKIQAFSQRIISKEGDSFSPFTRDYFSRINAAAERMQNLIDALLSYSRTNSFSLSLENTDLNVLVADVLADLQDIAEEKNAVITVGKLPSINSVPIQVNQLFVNLVTNSIKYSKPGIAPEISINAVKLPGKDIRNAEADQQRDYWRISIADNGIGFEQQYEHKIFELFQRLHGSGDYIGTGIGLAICKKIMRNHRGIITAVSEPGKGATFHIFFPVI